MSRGTAAAEPALRGLSRTARIPQPHVLELVTGPTPQPGPGEVLIRVKAAAICGSDLHLYRGRHPDAPLPSAVGHELAGDVVAVGPDVVNVVPAVGVAAPSTAKDGAAAAKLGPGDRVIVEPVLPCGECEFCRGGRYNRCVHISFGYRRGHSGLADHYVAPARWVHRLPAGLSYEEGAIIEPLAVAVHAVRTGQVGLGDRVAVFGAGPVGLLVAQVCRAAGAAEVWVVDIRESRLALASRVGATGTVNARVTNPVQALAEATGGRLVTHAFEAVGSEMTLVQALDVLRKGGKAILIGIFENTEVRLQAPVFVRKEVSLEGVSGYCGDFPPAIALAASGRVDLRSLITHSFPLARVDEAFRTAASAEAGACKVIVRPE